MTLLSAPCDGRLSRIRRIIAIAGSSALAVTLCIPASLAANPGVGATPTETTVSVPSHLPPADASQSVNIATSTSPPALDTEAATPEEKSEAATGTGAMASTGVDTEVVAEVTSPVETTVVGETTSTSTATPEVSDTLNQESEPDAGGAVDSAPLDSAPVDSAPLDSASVDSTPLDSSPVDTAPPSKEGTQAPKPTEDPASPDLAMSDLPESDTIDTGQSADTTFSSSDAQAHGQLSASVAQLRGKKPKFGTLAVRVSAGGFPARDFLAVYTCRGPERQFEGTAPVRSDDQVHIIYEHIPLSTMCGVYIRDKNSSAGEIEGHVYTIEDNDGVLPMDSSTQPVVHFALIKYRPAFGNVAVKLETPGTTQEFTNRDFEGTYSCHFEGSGRKSAEGRFTVKGNGVPTLLPTPVPVNSGCEITVKVPRVEDTDLTPFAEKVRVITEGKIIPLSFVRPFSTETNQIEVSVKATGTSDAPYSEYTVEYQCDQSGRGTVTVMGDGTPAVGEKKPRIGENCTIWLHRTSSDWASMAVPPPQGFVVTASPSPLHFEFTPVFHNNTAPFKIEQYDKGAPEAAYKVFVFHYSCSDGSQGSIKTVDRFTTTDAVFPIGTRCTVKQDWAASQIPGYTASIKPAQTITISRAPLAEAPFFTDYKPTGDTPRGTFSVVAQAWGAPGVADKTYTYDYQCGTFKGTIKAKGNGIPAPAGWGFPEGTMCTIAQRNTDTAIDGYTLTKPPVQQVRIIPGLYTKLTFNNYYTKDVPRGTFAVYTDPRLDHEYDGGPDWHQNEYRYTYDCEGVTGTLATKGDMSLVESDKSFPVGTRCTITQDPSSAALHLYTYTPPDPVTVTINDPDSPVQAGFTVEYSLIGGTFKIVKNAAGAPGAQEKSYSFNYSCGLNGVAQSDPSWPKTLTAQGDGEATTAPVVLPQGTVCVITEDTSAAGVDGYTLDSSEPQSVTIDADTPAVAGFTNTYTPIVVEPSTGTFTLRKTGTGADTTGKYFTFTYTCGTDNGELVVPGDGSMVASKVRVPVGTKCTVKEDASSAQIDGYTLTPPEEQTFTITTKDEVQALSFTNTYEATTPPPVQTGTFTVTKTGKGADTTGKYFTFTYTCGTDNGEVVVPGDGSMVASKVRIPIGTKCTVKEDTSSAQIDGYTLTPPEEQTFTITTKDEVQALSFTNTYTKKAPSIPPPPGDDNPPTTNPGTNPPASDPPASDPPASNPPVTKPPAAKPPFVKPPATKPAVTKPGVAKTVKPGGKLASTGADLGLLTASSIGLLMTGATAIALRKRRS